MSISNRQDELLLTPALEATIRAVAEGVMKKEAVDPRLEVGIILTDDEQIRVLNRDYRGLDEPTDVLSFAYLEDNPGEPDYQDAGEMEEALGDIVISCQRAQAQARVYGHSLARELGFLVAHGMYHLLGYDHLTAAEEEIMQTKQGELLADLGLFR